ncbi:hypothetical protein DFJ77DRAFT_472142 [Powellomyces hirtus]|nr:hypothetical protein DFJ77DRAFT_472142 [Powellomyces hirtus]
MSAALFPRISVPRFLAPAHRPAVVASLGAVVAAPPTATFAGAALEWLSGLLWAVPKKKTTHRKKRLRMATKWLKPMRNISTCPFCGQPTLRHHLCRSCTKQVLP